MQLRETIRKIRQEKNWTQAQLAQQLNTNQQMIQGMENAGSNLEKQFAAFLRLLPLMAECDLLTERDLQRHAPHEPKTDSRGTAQSKAQSDFGREQNAKIQDKGDASRHSSRTKGVIKTA